MCHTLVATVDVSLNITRKAYTNVSLHITRPAHTDRHKTSFKPLDSLEIAVHKRVNYKDRCYFHL